MSLLFLTGKRSLELETIPATALLGLYKYRKSCEFAAYRAVQREITNELEFEYGCVECSSLDGHEEQLFIEIDLKEYKRVAGELVRHQPCGTAVMESRVLSSPEFVKNANTHCRDCMLSVARAMNLVRRSLAMAVESAVEEVRVVHDRLFIHVLYIGATGRTPAQRLNAE